MHVEPVRKRGTQDRREVPVARGPSWTGSRKKRQVGRSVISDRIRVVRTGAQPSVTRTVVVLDAGTIIGMVGVGMSASLVVGRERICRMLDAICIDICQPSLSPVGSRQPAE